MIIIKILAPFAALLVSGCITLKTEDKKPILYNGQKYFKYTFKELVNKENLKENLITHINNNKKSFPDDKKLMEKISILEEALKDIDSILSKYPQDSKGNYIINYDLFQKDDISTYYAPGVHVGIHYVINCSASRAEQACISASELDKTIFMVNFLRGKVQKGCLG